MHETLSQLWSDFNANGGVPVLTAFGGVIVTIAGNYVLQERRDALRDERRLRDAKRERGEELYKLVDQWTKGVVKNSHSLSMAMKRKNFTQSDVWNANGDGNKFTRVKLLVDLDFPSTRPALDALTAAWAKLHHLVFELMKQRVEPSGEYGTQIAVQAEELWKPAREFHDALTQAMRDLYKTKQKP